LHLLIDFARGGGNPGAPLDGKATSRVQAAMMDSTIELFKDLIDEGDILIDGGNEW
jgi:hypothetical protein